MPDPSSKNNRRDVNELAKLVVDEATVQGSPEAEVSPDEGNDQNAP